MLPKFYHETAAESNTNKRKRWDRLEKVEMLEIIKSIQGVKQLSMRKTCAKVGVARTTVQGWNTCRENIDASPREIEFFETAEGVDVLHRVLLAIQFVVTTQCGGGIRQVCEILKISGLDRFIASSYGTQCELIAMMEQFISGFGEQQKMKLAKEMRTKEITVCQDETFHPDVCLVAIEPASGYLLLEKYAEKRDSATWTKEMCNALSELPVSVVQSTSDEARALIKHAEKDNDAHHSPDVFHVQQELGKGTSGPLGSKLNRAREAVQKAQSAKNRIVRSSGQKKKHSAVLVKEAELVERRTYDDLKRIEERHESIREAVRGIAECYHPFDLSTGEIRTAARVEEDLQQHFSTIFKISEELALSERCLKHINKAHRVLPRMVQTVAFYHTKCSQTIEALGLPEQIELFLTRRWIPARYVQLVASRTQTAEKRNRLLSYTDKLIPSEESLSKLFKDLQPLGITQNQILNIINDCAQLFQRSSSQVEGRNSYLSLFHHHYHHLSDRKLTALTVVHNFYKRRRDNLTAANRFFEQDHPELFSWLLDQMPIPAYPSIWTRKSKAA